LICLTVTGGAWAGSPFALRVEAADVASDHVDVRVALGVPSNHVVYAESFRVTSEDSPPEKQSGPAPDAKPDLLDPSRAVSVFAHPFESLWRLAPRRPGMRVTVAFQGCSDKTCFMPETHTFRFEAASDRFVEVAEDGRAPAPARTDWVDGYRMSVGGGYLTTDEFLAFLDRADGHASARTESGFAAFLRDPLAYFRAHGWLLTVLLVLLGGVLLNLTPCVLPMIPVNLAIIGAGMGTSGRGFLLGTAYGAGMVAAYGGTGWIVLRSGLFFGALQASPWFSLTMAMLFAALSLALFDVFEIDFTRLAGASGPGRRQGFLPALVAGALSALLAGACVAPVVLAVLLLAGSLHAAGVTGAQFLPFVLGLGMALPWPLAGAGLSVLPHPGKWMVRVKQVFGVFLVLLALYYGALAVEGFRSGNRAARDGSILAGDREAWEECLAQAKRESKPVFVDFWATWCKNCTAMEKTTFSSESVKERLADYVVVHVQAEHPEREPAKGMLRAFGVRGLPGFAVIRPDGQ